MSDCNVIEVCGQDCHTIEVYTNVINVGGSGGGTTTGFYFEHVQNTAASTITVNHNLGARPNVQVFTLGGAMVEAEILHTSTNQTQVFFDSPNTAIVVCS